RALDWSNRASVQVLREWFPTLQKGETDDEMIGWCPLQHPDGVPVHFRVHRMPEGWAIDFCDLGDSPSEIMEGRIRSREVGADDGETRAKKEPLFLPVADFFARCGERVEYILEPYLPKTGFVI